MPTRLCHQLATLAVMLLAATAAANPQAAVPPASQPAAPEQTKTKRPGPRCEPLSDVLSGGNPGETNPGQAVSLPANRDVCIETHVYDVVELNDGTRFLDVCPANVPDEKCRFVLVSLPSDRDTAGDLSRYRDQNIKLRGILRSIHGRMGIVISHGRQFEGGTEKFRPNPRLLRGFNAQSDRMPVHDPNLMRAGHHRSFMNTRDQETLPEAKR